MKKILAAMIALALLLCGAALAEEASGNTILTVRGTGIVHVTADCATVVLGVRERSKEVLDAQAAVNAKINAICDALVEAGVDRNDIGTEMLNIYANYDYSTAEETLTGYTATNTLSIRTTEMDRVGEYIDIAFGAGANELDYVNFTAQDTEEAQEEALRLAVQSAQKKGQIIAAAAGMDIVSVEAIDEATEYYGSNDGGAIYGNVREAAADAAGATVVQASTIQISANVVMKFALSESGV